MWSMWAWEMKRKSWEIARWGHRPISNANFRVGKIMQVSWPPMDKPSIGYPSIFNPLLFFKDGSEFDSGFSSTESEILLLDSAIVDWNKFQFFQKKKEKRRESLRENYKEGIESKNIDMLYTHTYKGILWFHRNLCVSEYRTVLGGSWWSPSMEYWSRAPHMTIMTFKLNDVSIWNDDKPN